MLSKKLSILARKYAINLLISKYSDFRLFTLIICEDPYVSKALEHVELGDAILIKFHRNLHTIRDYAVFDVEDKLSLLIGPRLRNYCLLKPLVRTVNHGQNATLLVVVASNGRKFVNHLDSFALKHANCRRIILRLQIDLKQG